MKLKKDKIKLQFAIPNAPYIKLYIKIYIEVLYMLTRTTFRINYIIRQITQLNGLKNM